MIRYHWRLIRNYLRWRMAGKPRGLLSRVQFKASAMDCDVIGHINNARYLEFLDCGRTDFILRSGLAAKSRDQKLLLVVGSINIRYRKEVKRGARFAVETTFARIDGKAIVFSHKIFVGDQLMTEAEAACLCLKDKKVISPEFLLPLLQGGEETTPAR
jgi:thioesterase-3